MQVEIEELIQELYHGLTEKIKNKNPTAKRSTENVS